MTETTPMAIIKVNPDPEDYLETQNEFLQAVGECVTQWAFVDRELFRLFRFSLGTDHKRAALLYYENKTLSQHKKLADTMLRYYLGAHTKKVPADANTNKWVSLFKTWVSLFKTLDKLIPTRNIIVHQPVKRTGTHKNGKAVYPYSIYYEPYQQDIMNNKNLARNYELQIADLKTHAIDTAHLVQDLRLFARTLFNSGRAAVIATSAISSHPVGPGEKS